MKKLRSRAFLGLLAAMLAGELGFRLWDHFHGKTGSLYDYVVPTGARFKMRPDTAVVVPERYGDIQYHFNHEGYRDANHDPASPQRRVVWLGDSVSFGLGVEREKTFVGRLQKRLAARSPSWEIVNLAIFAYNTRHELETLEEDGLQYHPKLIVLQFYMNDFSIFQPGLRGATEVTWGDRLAAAKNRLVYKSALYLRVQQALLGTNYLLFHDLRRRHFPDTLNATEPRGELAYLATHPADESLPTFAALAGIARAAQRNQARLLVLISPDEVQLFTGRYDAINRRVGAFCARQGISTFDPLPALRASSRRTELFYDGVHYSERGHALLELLLAEKLDRGGFLQD